MNGKNAIEVFPFLDYGRASTQVAQFVALMLVFINRLVGPGMNLVFAPFEVVSIVLSVVIASRLTADGECNWMEGVLLVDVYLPTEFAR